MSLSSDKMRDKVATQLFEDGDYAWGKLAELHPCWPLQCGREGPTHNLIWSSLQMLEGFEGLQMVEWIP